MEIRNITIGAAGHIDHGKSELIYQLTNIHPDRLIDEKTRGMSIDLGYALYETSTGLTVGIIDMPGHGKFIKNMVAGAASVQLVILVVAADDGVMPQTREHLSILTFLGIKKGIVALTKVDLVNPEIAEVAKDEIDELIQGTFLEGAPIIPVSSLTGEGLDRFRENLDTVIDSFIPQSPSGVFRMPIQRVFSVKGFGTVITGVPLSGKISVGDPVEIYPSGALCKVRGIEAFDRNCLEGVAGLRTALNISNVDYHTLSRGNTVASPGCYRSTSFIEAGFTLLKSSRLLKNMMEVKVHTGTSEALANLVLLDHEKLEPGESAIVQLRLKEALVVVPGDRFILRLHSSQSTIGGGEIIGITPVKLKRFKKHILDRLTAKRDNLFDLKHQVCIEAESPHYNLISPRELALALNASPDLVENCASDLEALGVLIRIQDGLFMHKNRFNFLAENVTSFLDKMHSLHPLDPYLDTKILKGVIEMEGKSFRGFLKAMTKQGLIETEKGGRVCKKGFVAHLSKTQLDLIDLVEKRIYESAATPPKIEELLNWEISSSEEIDSAIRYLVRAGRLIKVGIFVFHSRIMDDIREAVVKMLMENGQISFHEIRDCFKTTRKWILPILDYFDSCGLTIRIGNTRRLRQVKYNG